MQVVANGPHYYLAGVQPDADLQLHAVDPATLLSIGPHGRLHGQGSVAGAQGVVFVGDGSTE